ncbi:palmitoleoyl-protein carboxylesterase notum2-like isoform 2-T2 [Discoglossus pictus]
MDLLGTFLLLLILGQVTSQNKRPGRISLKLTAQNKKNLQRNTEVEGVHLEGTSGEQRSAQARVLTLAPGRDQRSSEDMKLHLLRNTEVTCNDGTPAGYYLREVKGSKKWLIFLEGGWCCYSAETCDVRYHHVKRLMSSSEWTPTRKGSGILSPKQEENPHWWTINSVFVPYCSSDVWSGNSSRPQHDFTFMGSLIIQEVIRDLAPKGLKHAKVVTLAGSSAGGTGVLINIDRVAPLVEELTTEAVQVRGLVDSGWFLDPKHTKQSDCLDNAMCAPTDAIKKGLKLWSGILPERCRRQNKREEEWKCFYGPKIHTTLKSPVFVVQWLYDEEQLRMENIPTEFQSMTARHWNNIQSVGREVKRSLHDVQAVFAPACLSHTLITKSNWLDYQVKSVSLSRALHCWEKSLQDRKGPKAPTRGCPFHLIDNCPWPHCNPTCPALYDQTSGQGVSLLQRFLRMGLDYQKRDPTQLMTMLRNGG